MDYEKKYKDALERAREQYNKRTPLYDIESIFPELQENKDERIRKELIENFKWFCGDYPETTKWGKDDNLLVKDIIAWLEKQGEKKPTENIETKFCEGDKVVSNQNGKVYTVGTAYNITGDNIRLDGIDGNYKWTNKDDLNRNYHLWTIADAKDGDVLVNGSNIFIFHFLNDTRLMGYCHVNIDDGRFYDDLGKNECFCLIDAIVTPATKIQRDMLFQKMKEAGYKWDSEKKELKKIEPKTLYADKVIEWLKPYSVIVDNIVDEFKKDFGLC